MFKIDDNFKAMKVDFELELLDTMSQTVTFFDKHLEKVDNLERDIQSNLS